MFSPKFPNTHFQMSELKLIWNRFRRVSATFDFCPNAQITKYLDWPNPTQMVPSTQICDLLPKFRKKVVMSRWASFPIFAPTDSPKSKEYLPEISLEPIKAKKLLTRFLLARSS